MTTRIAITRILIVLAVVIAGAVPAAFSASAVQPSVPSDPCVVGVTVEDGGRMWSCVDQAGTPTWVDLGHVKPPTATCEPGSISRFNGSQWKCTSGSSGNVLVRVGPWRQPAVITTAPGSFSNQIKLTVRANSPLTGCRLTSTEPALLRGSRLKVSGQTATSTLATRNAPAGTHTIRVTCRDPRMNGVTDVLVGKDGSVLLRSQCLDRWHDEKYADVVPGYGRRLSPAEAGRLAAACRSLAPLTLAEMNRVSQEAFERVGLLAEQEVRRVSAARGIPICQAIDEVFKPVDALGRRVMMSPTSSVSVGPISGYLPDGYFPVLYRQWQDGPFRLKNTAGCGSGNQALRLYNTTWMGCPGLGSYGSFDPAETYPAFDAAKCPPSVEIGSRPDASVCIVWGDDLGNDIVGGRGRVFSAMGPLPNDSFDCQDRALRRGLFRNVADPVPTPL